MFEPQDIRASLPKYGREFAYTVLSFFTFVRSSSSYLFVLEEFKKKRIPSENQTTLSLEYIFARWYTNQDIIIICK